MAYEKCWQHTQDTYELQWALDMKGMDAACWMTDAVRFGEEEKIGAERKDGLLSIYPNKIE